MTVRQYIRNSWDKSLRTRGHRPDGIALPYPYNSPCAEGIFDEFYYWDTCFTNKGLIADGKYEDALHNVLNMAYLIDRYGYMPNAAVTGMLNRSQPPLFGVMVRDIMPYVGTQEKQALIGALEREYRFWMSRRLLPSGLNRYGNSADREARLLMADEAERRLSRSFDGVDRETLGGHILAECESGWDFSPRFGFHCMDYAPIDLNSLLYLYEQMLADYLPDKRGEFLSAAAQRKERLYKYCFDGTKLTDTIPGGAPTKVTSAACALPFAVGLSDDRGALLSVVRRLEHGHGIAACEKTDDSAVCQWGYPNMWAPLVWFVYCALVNVGLLDDSARIGQKYLSTVEQSFGDTGKLWEKYDAVRGGKATVNEYTETEMLGWTAGVYNAIYDELNQ